MQLAEAQLVVDMADVGMAALVGRRFCAGETKHAQDHVLLGLRVR